MRVDNPIIFDIMLNIIIVVVIFIITTIKEQLPPSPSPYNPHKKAVVIHVSSGKLLPHRFRFAPIRSRGRSAQQHGLGGVAGVGAMSPSRAHCEQGQPKPQLGGGAQPTTTTKPQGGWGRAPPQARPHPTGGAGGDTMGWTGEGGCGSPASYMHACPCMHAHACMPASIHSFMHSVVSVHTEASLSLSLSLPLLG